MIALQKKSLGRGKKDTNIWAASVKFSRLVMQARRTM
jgi:hypothetical protein